MHSIYYNFDFPITLQLTTPQIEKYGIRGLDILENAINSNMIPLTERVKNKEERVRIRPTVTPAVQEHINI